MSRPKRLLTDAIRAIDMVLDADGDLDAIDFDQLRRVAAAGKRQKPLKARVAAVRNALELLVTSCKEALEGSWDRSDDGFVAMIDTAEAALAELEEVRHEED